MALYTYILQEGGRTLALDSEAVSDIVAYREGMRFAGALLSERSAPGKLPIGFRLVVRSPDGREVCYVRVDASDPPKG